jgi:hypothetical protein
VSVDRDELQALKDGFDALTRLPSVEVDIAFSPVACRRIGTLIAKGTAGLVKPPGGGEPAKTSVQKKEPP